MDLFALISAVLSLASALLPDSCADGFFVVPVDTACRRSGLVAGLLWVAPLHHVPLHPDPAEGARRGGGRWKLTAGLLEASDPWSGHEVGPAVQAWGLPAHRACRAGPGHGPP
eukprot:337205-Alexandrium_andersonii.AAC.1